MLGLSGLFTTHYMGAGLEEKAVNYYEAHNFKDFDLASSYGISEANLEKIKAEDYVTDAEGVIQADGAVTFGGQKRNVTVLSLTKRVSVPDLEEGKFPTASDECIIGEDFAEVEGLKVGDKLHISITGLSSLQDKAADARDVDIEVEDVDLEDSDEEAEAEEETAEEADDETEDAVDEKEPLLYETDFTITGLMCHPDFLRRKAVKTVALPLAAFNEDATEGLYTRAFVRIEQPKKTGMFSQAYFDETEDERLALQDLATELETDRTQEIKDSAFEYIDKEWEKAEARLNDAQDEIDSGQAELDSELADGRKKLSDAQKELDRETAKYEKLFKDGEKTISEKEKELADGKALLEKNKKTLADAKKKIEAGKREIDKREKELKAGKKKLKAGKKQLEESKEMLGGDEKIEEIEASAKKIRKLMDEIDELLESGEDQEAAEKKIKELGRYILDNSETIKEVFEYTKDEDVLKNLEEKEDFLDDETKEAIDAIKNQDYDELIKTAEIMAETGSVEEYQKIREPLSTDIDWILGLIDELHKAEDEISKAEKKIADGEKKLAKGKRELKVYQAELRNGEAELAKAEQTLKNGEKLLKQKKSELKEGKEKFAAEKAAGQRKINNGWNEYYEQKAKYEEKIAEAVALLKENRELAEKKLAEARAEVDSIEKCNWIVLDRKGNAGYVDIKANIDAISTVGILFGILFSLITAIVCFSTLVIIIDEQKTMVGTAKAFGFHKREILAKYIIFGVSAAVVGSILAMIVSYIMSNVIQIQYARSGMYPIGVARGKIMPIPTIAGPLGIILVTVAATVFACSGILRSPASLLMKGAVLKKEKKNKNRKKTVSRSGSLYSRLIIRNMVQDKARVLVTIAIIGFSCMLIGLGISMKLAYTGMMDKQMADVNRFDVRMDMNEDVTDEEEAALAEVLKKNGTSYLPATMETTLYNWDDRFDGVTVICADPDRIGEFYGVIDQKTGEDIPLPDDGILIQKRMHESYGMNVGDKLTVLDSSLKAHEADITGTFINYVGRTVVASPAAYKSIFGEANDNNCFYVKLNGADEKKLEDELLAVTDNVSFEVNGEFKSKFESVSQLYSIIVAVTTGIAIIISFMILTNLANIYLTRKKTELTIMRVNGFRIKEARGYLSRESIVTTVCGLLLGVALGAVLTPIAIAQLQQPDLEFVKTFQPFAWGLAVGLETLFTVVINSAVYRKVKDLNLRDIA